MADEKQAQPKPVTYICVDRCFHSAEQKDYLPGSVISLKHLSDETIQTLLAMGAVRVTHADIKHSELEQLRGIKAETAKSLAAIGITNRNALVEADAGEIEAKVGLVSLKQVMDWQAAARKSLDEAERLA